MKTTSKRLSPGRKVNQRRLIRQLILQMRDDSEHCHGCRRPYYHGEYSTVGYDAARKLIMVGECCMGRLVSMVAISIYFAPDLPMPRA
jgi:hypothetical protein